MKRFQFIFLILFFIPCFIGCNQKEESVITLRIGNWEEYIDEGGWDENERIDLSEECNILGKNPLYEDFEKWYYENYGIDVKVEYSTFGTNEDIYNQLTLGDTFDLICPSEYMIMKLIEEDWLEPFSYSFFDKENPDNFYIKGVSPFIQRIFDSNEINGESWGKYAAGYMWGTSGIVYNPEVVSKEDASTWKILNNSDYFRRVTMKDNVRDSYFAGLGILKSDLLTDKSFVSADDYKMKLEEEMNDTSAETIQNAEKLLKQVKNNVYSFESDSGKADMITGKVAANYQWSGDAVYTMDQADEEGTRLCYTVPEECGNLWFDGWVMMKNGINGDHIKQQAAEAFVNYLSRPDNVVRNMYYIGYTSVIAGGEDSTIYDYADWCYGVEEETDDAVDYDISYFFKSSDEKFIITADSDQIDRQLYAQYPSEEVMERCAVMNYFDKEENAVINQMWINVRCFDFTNSLFWK